MPHGYSHTIDFSSSTKIRIGVAASGNVGELRKFAEGAGCIYEGVFALFAQRLSQYKQHSTSIPLLHLHSSILNATVHY